MQLIEFDFKNLIAGILLFLSGCFSSEQTIAIHDKQLEFLYVAKNQQEAVITVNKNKAEDIVPAIRYLAKQLVNPENLPVHFKQVDDDVTRERMIPVLREKNPKPHL